MQFSVLANNPPAVNRRAQRNSDQPTNPSRTNAQRGDSSGLSGMAPPAPRIDSTRRQGYGTTTANHNSQSSAGTHPLEHTSMSSVFALDVTKGLTVQITAPQALGRGNSLRSRRGGTLPGQEGEQNSLLPPRLFEQKQQQPPPSRGDQIDYMPGVYADKGNHPVSQFGFSSDMSVVSEVTMQESSRRDNGMFNSTANIGAGGPDPSGGGGGGGGTGSAAFPAQGDYEFKSRKEYVQDIDVTPNNPSAALEFPPLYFLVRRFPLLLGCVQSFFRFRWKVSYPLQRRIPLSRTLRKMNVFLTWGEVLILLPFFVCIVAGTVYTFMYPSVRITGQTSRTPLIFAFGTAVHNSFLTLLLGMPFERAVWYHKFAARIAYFNGLLHTYVAFFYPSLNGRGAFSIAQNLSYLGPNTDIFRFLFADQVNSAGTSMVLFMTFMLLTALPWMRRKIFEAFYFAHIALAVCVVAGAFFHTGILVPILVLLTWGVDLFIRRLVMATCRYPNEANVRIISDSVVEVCFPKTAGFDYNPGQYVFLCVPELSLFEWHPFSLSSSPLQSVVTFHIRKAGTWTTALYELAKKKDQVSILFEGPYGSTAVDLMSNRYKMVILFSGGIGVTPMQAICNQLMYEHNTKKRQLKKLSFVWVERDPVVMDKVDVVRRTSTVLLQPGERVGDQEALDAQSVMTSGRAQDLASTLLSLVPASNVSDAQLENLYPSHEFEDLDDLEEDNMSIFNAFTSTRNQGKTPIPNEEEYLPDDETFLKEAYQQDDSSTAPEEALDLQVYLTAKNAVAGVENLPFVHLRRPDVKAVFAKMREDAIEKGEKRVAVCVCAPKRLVNLCQKASAKYSDSKVAFDFHYEVFE